MQEYIKIPGIYQKLKNAEFNYSPIYIGGMAGFGKTVAVEYYLRRKGYIKLTGVGGRLSEMPDPEESRYGIIVIDDVSWITDEESKQYIQKLLFRKDLWIIMIGRSQLPDWLRLVDLKLNITRASEKDLVFSEKEIRELFMKHGMNLSSDLLKNIYEFSGGYAVCVILTMKRMEDGGHFDDELINKVRDDMFQYSDHAFWEYWSSELKEMVLSVCEFDYFTPGLVHAVTGKENVSEIISNANSIGSFIRKIGENKYSFNRFLHRYFKWKRSFVCSEEEVRKSFVLSARYFEEKNDILLAIKYYEKGHDKEDVLRLLSENAKLYPGKAQYFDLRQYYFAIPKKDLKCNDDLIVAMATISSIMLNPDESEKWYNILCKRLEEKLTVEEEKRVRRKIAYLDITLPNHLLQDKIRTAEDAIKYCEEFERPLTNIAVTMNMPSVINGNHDWSVWTLNRKDFSMELQHPLEKLLGKYSQGLMEIALAETGFERDDISDFEFSKYINRGILLAQTRGEIEILFAGNGVLMKHHIAQGRINTAVSILESTMEQAKVQGADYLNHNMEAMSAWLSMLQGETQKVESWLRTAPDENKEFCTIRRYQYMQKARALISLEKYTEALSLLERLLFYFTEYDYILFWIEAQTLMAIIHARMFENDWKELLRQACEKAREYNYIHVIAFEGNAIKPLLQEMDKITEDAAYDRAIIQKVNTIAKFYPDYMKQKEQTEKIAVLFTEREKQILNLMKSGASSEEICNVCNITYNSLKFHNKNIYKKLGVKSRQEAERKAEFMNIYS